MSTRRRKTFTIAALTAIVGSLSLAPASANAVDGAFSAAFAEDPGVALAAPQNEADSAAWPTAVSAIVLPDGNVAFWNGLQDTENLKYQGAPLASSIPQDQKSKSRVLNLRSYFASGQLPDADDFSIPSPEDGDGADMFCSDQRLLADGRVLVVGGTIWVNEDEAVTNGTPLEGVGRSELYGAQDARIFDYETNTWANEGDLGAADMEHGRWYPAMLTLPDGDQFVAGGVGRLIYNSQLFPGQDEPESLAPINIRETETYDVSENRWIQNGDSVSLPLYARIHLMPDGKVLYDTAGQAWGPFGEDTDELTWGTPKVYDPADSSWTDAATSGLFSFLGHRSGAFSVMLPLEPDDVTGEYGKADVLIGGGVLLPSPGALVAVPITEVMSYDVATGAVTRDPTGNLNAPRWFSSGVGLPTGEVLAFNGADLDEVIFPGIDAAVRQTELWNPETGEWTAVAMSGRERTYHNSAVLLKDGSVLVGGHSPIVAGYGWDHGSYRSNGFKDASFEIYKPPYMFADDRPAINGVSSVGDTYTVGTEDTDAEVVLVRLPGTTHVTDADQRTVIVDSDEVDGGLEFTLPDANVVPPGYYYVFLVEDTPDGKVPSVAEIINVQ